MTRMYVKLDKIYLKMIELIIGGLNMKESKNQNEMKNFGELLKQRRNELQMTQEAAATALKVSLSVYTGLELGTYRANMRILTKLSIFLEKTLKETFKLYFDKD